MCRPAHSRGHRAPTLGVCSSTCETAPASASGRSGRATPRCSQPGSRTSRRESARLRFLAPKPRFTLAELRYLTEVDHVDHFALVAVLADAPHVRRLFARISGHLETALEGGVYELTAALAA